MDKEDVLILRERYKCPHIGELEPSKFNCLECEDTADKCNCICCNGVYCNICDEPIYVSCEKIKQAYKAWHRE